MSAVSWDDSEAAAIMLFVFPFCGSRFPFLLFCFVVVGLMRSVCDCLFPGCVMDM